MPEIHAASSTADTPLVREMLKDPERKKERLGEVPLGRMASPDIADLKNISGARWGGSIVAAVFLQQDDLREEIAVTVVHEIAHHFGIEEETLHDLGWG